MEFPKLELKGGPHGRNIEFKVDGETVPRTKRVELVADVNDVVRVVTTQYVEIASVDVEGLYSPLEKVKAVVKLHRPKEDGWTEMNEDYYEGEGETLREALEAALAEAEKLKEPRL